MKEGQWYPGTMARAVEQLGQDLKAVDLVVEMLDARIPASSRNPAFNKLFKPKKHLFLLHKADRAEDRQTERWLTYFLQTGYRAMAFSVKEKHYTHRLLDYLKQEGESLRSGRLKRPLRLIFVGIPNVGKSTLINHFARKAVTRTGNRPGITRGKQWVRIMPGMDLLDTPGILQPKITEKTIRPLAAIGALPAGRVDNYDTAVWLINQYRQQDRFDILRERYRSISPGEDEQILEQIGVVQGCLQAGGTTDLERTAALLLRDFQAGALGRFTLEYAPL